MMVGQDTNLEHKLREKDARANQAIRPNLNRKIVYRDYVRAFLTHNSASRICQTSGARAGVGRRLTSANEEEVSVNE